MFFCRLECVITLGTLTLSDIKRVCILHTISKAWCLGRAVYRAQSAKTDPVMAVTTSMNGKLIISGKVRTCVGMELGLGSLYVLIYYISGNIIIEKLCAIHCVCTCVCMRACVCVCCVLQGVHGLLLY